MVTDTEEIARRMKAARLRDWREAVKAGVISEAEGQRLVAAHEIVARVVEVDDFAPDELSPVYRKDGDVHEFFQALGEQRAAE